jgi:hypothetical protein
MKDLKVEIILPNKIKKRRISKEIKEYIEAVKAAERLSKLLDEVNFDEIEKEAENFRKKFKFRDFSH